MVIRKLGLLGDICRFGPDGGVLDRSSFGWGAFVLQETLGRQRISLYVGDACAGGLRSLLSIVAAKSVPPHAMESSTYGTRSEVA